MDSLVASFKVLFAYLLPLFDFIFLMLFIICKETEQGVAQAIIRSVIDFKRDPWPRVSETAKDLVRKMLEPDPKKRLSAAQVLGMYSIWLCVSGIYYYLWNKYTVTLLFAEHSWIQNAKKAPNVSLGETVKARLKQFSVMNKLKKRALRVVIPFSIAAAW